MHTTHVPSPQSGHGITNLPELQCLRRLRLAAQTHHGRTRNWERSSFTGKGQDWTGNQTLLAEHTTQCTRVEGATARLHHKLLHTSGSRRHLAAKPRQCQNPPPTLQESRAHSPFPASDASRRPPYRAAVGKTGTREAQAQLSSLQLPGTQIWRQGRHPPLPVILIG